MAVLLPIFSVESIDREGTEGKGQRRGGFLAFVYVIRPALAFNGRVLAFVYVIREFRSAQQHICIKVAYLYK